MKERDYFSETRRNSPEYVTSRNKNKSCLQSRKHSHKQGQTLYPLITNYSSFASEKSGRPLSNQFQIDFAQRLKKQGENSPSKVMKLIQCENQFYDCSPEQSRIWEKSAFMKSYADKLKRERKKLAKRNKKIFEEQKLQKIAETAPNKSTEPNFVIKLSQQQSLSPENRKDVLILSNFNWPSKKPIPKHFYQKKRALSPQIHSKQFEFRNRKNQRPSNTSQVSRFTQSIVLNKEDLKNGYLGSNLSSAISKFQNDYRISPKKRTKYDKTFQKHKLDMKKLQPWNQDLINVHGSNRKIHKMDEFSIEDYHLENSKQVFSQVI